VDLAGAVEAQLDHAGGNQARAFAAGIAGDAELRRERVEAALGGTLADVQRLGDLRPTRGTTGEGTLAAVRGDQGCRGRPLLLAERDARLADGDGFAATSRLRDRDFEPMTADDQGVTVAQPPRPVERLAVQRRAITAVEISRHQGTAPALNFEVAPGHRLVVDANVRLGIAADHGAPRRQRRRVRLAALGSQPDARVHRLASIEFAPVTAADDEKRIAAEAAAELVKHGMTVGLGTGSTVAYLLPAIAARGLTGIRCVATSVATEQQARELGIPVEDFSELERLDIAIDGADQVTPDGWLIKGGGGAHLREKIVAAAAERFVVIADSSKPVDSLSAPVPLELFTFGLHSTLARLGSEVELRDAARSPDDGVIADYRGPVADPVALSAWLEADPGVAAHGLFPPTMVSDVLIGSEGAVNRLTLA
jgi:ribose 5-phosphate isomerase A